MYFSSKLLMLMLKYISIHYFPKGSDEARKRETGREEEREMKKEGDEGENGKIESVKKKNIKVEF